ncbi:MAG: hypothetical protein NW215_05160 [Hyphomicrobiales bacterium]|nr:hypothetical protein [Hyphomicrobiales bacterium]
MIATECGLEVGNIFYFAASMHSLQRDEKVLQEALTLPAPPSVKMPIMPKIPTPLSEIRILTILEAQMRHESSSITGFRMREWIRRCKSELDPYWAQFGILLLTAVARKNNAFQDYTEACKELNSYFKDFMPVSV